MCTGFLSKFVLSCLGPDPTHLRVAETSYPVFNISVLKSIASDYFSVRLVKFRKRAFLGIKFSTHTKFNVLDKILAKNLIKKKKLKRIFVKKNFKIAILDWNHSKSFCFKLFKRSRQIEKKQTELSHEAKKVKRF